jgi:hypothetical protein
MRGWASSCRSVSACGRNKCRLITHKICAIDPTSLDFVARGVEWPADERLVDLAPDLDAFSAFDGFSSFREMVDFWAETHAAEKFHGWHIRCLPFPQMRWT